tara:strand:+ start:96 stop:413 length:318 start_codon:yes stop_codon:yes gene_type:complete
MGRIKLETITDLARRGYNAKIPCLGCGHASHWNTVELAMELQRRRKSLKIDAVEPHMRCRACGKRGAMIQPVEMFSQMRRNARNLSSQSADRGFAANIGNFERVC